VDLTTAKLIPSEVLPQELQRIFPEGFIEGTVGALLADYLQNHAASNLTPRGYLNYRNTTRLYLASVFKLPLLQLEKTTCGESPVGADQERLAMREVDQECFIVCLRLPRSIFRESSGTPAKASR
jgi:hypothetical protein